jgi:hypothetical protein
MTRVRRLVLVTAAGALTGAASLVGAATPATADTQTVASCDRAGIQAALNAGGTWSLDPCSGQTITQDAHPLVVNGTTVTLTHDPSMSFPVLHFTATTATGRGAVIQVRSGNLTLQNLIVTGVLTSTDPTKPARGGALYVAPGAQLTLDDCSVSHSQVLGAQGVYGTDGTTNAVDGTDGGPSYSAAQGGGLYNDGTTTITASTFDNDWAFGGYAGDGGNGHRGANAQVSGGHGAPGGSGGDAGQHSAPAQGGAIYNAGMLTVVSSTISHSYVEGGSGGFAGDAADGGIGGFGTGGQNGANGTPDNPSAGSGTPGAPGGQGGPGGMHAGLPGPASEGDGGGIYNAGTAAIDHVTFTANSANGGAGGYGGSASAPNRGGGGGYGGSGGTPYDVVGHGLAGGNGADGGATGPTGVGGTAGANGSPGAAARGAAIYDATGNLRVSHSVFSGGSVNGGWGGYGGNASQPDDGGYFYGPGGDGGSAGNGGAGINGAGGNAGTAGNGGAGIDPSPGFAAGNGAVGGDASALSVYTAGGALIGCGTTLDSDATHRHAGPGGFGGTKGRGVTGSVGGKGGGKGYGGPGKPFGKRSAPGVHGFNGLRKNVFVPPGKTGPRGKAGPAGIDGAHGPLGCDSVGPLLLRVHGVVGTTATATATIHNRGPVPITMTQLGITGAASDVLSAAGCESGAPVGGSCAITVTFHPQTTTAVHATLVITDNTVFSTQSVPIIAVGTKS